MSVLAFGSLEDRVPPDVPLRTIRPITGRALERISPELGVDTRRRQRRPVAMLLISGSNEDAFPCGFRDHGLAVSGDAAREFTALALAHHLPFVAHANDCHRIQP